MLSLLYRYVQYVPSSVVETTVQKPLLTSVSYRIAEFYIYQK